MDGNPSQIQCAGVIFMNAVGIDVSKNKSMITVIQPLGVVIAEPYEARHTESELRELGRFSEKPSR